MHIYKNLDIQQLIEAINTLRLARKESSQAFIKASYSQKVQSVFDMLENRE